MGRVTSEASRNTALDATMISRCHGDDTIVAFLPMRFFRFWRKGEFTFFQRCLQPLYFSWSQPPTQSRIPFCAGVQFSRDYFRAFNDRLKFREKEGREQSKIPLVFFVRTIPSRSRTDSLSVRTSRAINI